MENSNPSKVAIIGLGNIGQVVAKNLVNHHRAIIVADRTFEKSQQLWRQS
jgi:saccharopine dehydrogenase-like NADP-dependent oxidoreductase